MTPSLVQELVENNLGDSGWILVAAFVVADETFYNLLRSSDTIGSV